MAASEDGTGQVTTYGDYPGRFERDEPGRFERDEPAAPAATPEPEYRFTPIDATAPATPETGTHRDGDDMRGMFVPETTGWVVAPTVADLDVGDVVRGEPDAIGGLLQAEVVRVYASSYHARTTHVIHASNNGRDEDLSALYLYGGSDRSGARRTLVWRGEGAAPAPDPAPDETPDPTPNPGFVVPQVGETFNRTYDEAGKPPRVNAVVSSVVPRTQGEGWVVGYQHPRYFQSTIHVAPDGTITNTNGDYPGRFERVADATPAPAPPVAEATPPAVPGLPDWATTLEEARRHIHAKARTLFRSGENCGSGTSDFVRAAGLPDHRRDYPAKDESAEIKVFLDRVREAAISTARAHGKSMGLVERWLREEGITEPEPVTHTVTVKAPAGTTAEEIMALLRRPGWEIS